MSRSLIACSRLSLALIVAGVTACSTADVGSGAAESTAVAGLCPQPRATARAPETYRLLVNPLPRTEANYERGRVLYDREARPERCVGCHGAEGDGKGRRSAGLDPPPRNFACAETMAGIPDGQLYWIIENGSGAYHLPSKQGAQGIHRPGRGLPDTAMRGHGDYLTSTEIWQLVLYIRGFAREERPPAGS
jgi:mono/diheme cytochrome c family protein